MSTVIVIVAVILCKTNGYSESSFDKSNPKSQFSTGVNIHFVEPNIKEVNKLQQDGFTVVRMDLFWNGIEKKKGSYDFSIYDKLVDSMSKRHMKIMFILDYGNNLYDKGLAPYSDQGRMAFANFAKKAVEHYKGKQIIWEIWNEPNGGFWKPKPDADAYAKLALETIKAIRSKDNNTFIVAPALAGFDYSYLNSLGKTGLFKYINAISVHPYRESNPESVTMDYNKLRELISKYPHNKKIQIFSGEWGYSTTWKGIDDTEQAQYCIREYLTNIMNGVNLSIWYDWKDDGINKEDIQDNFGTVYNNMKSKPTYYAIKTMNESLNGYSYAGREDVGSNADYVLKFEKGNKIVYAIWTIDNGHDISINLKNKNVQVVELTGKKYNVMAYGKKYDIYIDENVRYVLD